MRSPKPSRVSVSVNWMRRIGSVVGKGVVRDDRL
jgi:hypothetical protein